MRIVILGGGYSSIWCYRAVRRWMGESARITVIAPFTEQVFHGFTGEVLDGELSPQGPAWQRMGRVFKLMNPDRKADRSFQDELSRWQEQVRSLTSLARPVA